MARRLSVLVTRPSPGGERTAATIRKDGHEPYLLPLTEIVGRPAKLAGTDDYDAIILTSGNGVRYLTEEQKARLAHLRVWTVGEATAETARKHGFQHAEAIGGDAEKMAETLITERPAKLLYLAGRVRRDNLEKRLADAGISADVVETYDTQPRRPSREELQDLLVRQFDVVWLTSAFSAGLFRDLSAETGLARSATRLCFSKRIADAAGGSIRLAERADESAALTLLRQIAEE
ncbi:uroporphyrinogen-III synthase [Notoacmeibacter ruber]|uniref:Uroporphyrinogen-III synthase n=1 Tax=Notoacmeibacter ruber TaxID=2670375 RepID=A0A3L7JKI7_9HYPH|nr:uroporphyrinogen-III synthase [Notoacmeibacter ruber]RLQ89012.1 uroporphyrinogen-III synthase [Notoacmeibacter ruber]